MQGLTYRFTIWLPVQARGKPVFLPEQRLMLSALLDQCFGGFSQSSLEGFPPWTGTWLPEGTAEPIIDHHIHLIVYALQDIEAAECMRRLKWLLEQDHVAAQEIVLIEQVPVQFVEAAPIP
ncbi:MAG: hypothetical protein EXS16_14900 [Gemmataceae bacterium]|nr:hypothetical protein [Gemmataceae bacterium]